MVWSRSAGQLLLALVLVGAFVPATADARRHAPPRLMRVRCVPAGTPLCRGGVRVSIGRQLQFSGRRLYRGMRVSFRWPRGAIATRMIRSPIGYVARVPAGTAPGTVSVTVRDRAGRRSNAIRRRVAPVPRVGGPAPARGPLPAALAGNRMWIWHLNASDGGEPPAIAARARAAGLATVFVKCSGARRSLGAVQRGARAGAARLRRARVRVSAVYRADPIGEASLGVDAVADGADCLVIDAETEYEGRYAGRATVPAGAAGGRRAGLPARLDLVPVRRLPPATAVLGVPRPRRCAGEPAAGLLEGDRREREPRTQPASSTSPI
jgi:hypothetical protein